MAKKNRPTKRTRNSIDGMGFDSIRKYLKAYGIVQSRKTTVAHAFASAVAPWEPYDEAKVKKALTALGQNNLQQLTCVYCDELARTWDHVTGIVKDGQPNGYGHQIGNLVPCCSVCNSKKRQSFEIFIDNLPAIPTATKKLVKSRIRKHLKLAKIPEQPAKGSTAAAELDALEGEYRALQEMVLMVMAKADECAARIRDLRHSTS